MLETKQRKSLRGRPKSPPITDEDGRIIISMIRDGCTLAEAGAAIGRTREGVRQYLIRHGEHIPHTRTHNSDNIDKAIEWYNRKVPLRHIAFHFRMSSRTIYKHLKKRGFTSHNPKNNHV